ncbi:peroxidase P7-like [Amaranthus tricolor]|uniref:peroxidase P7-like n=1 Tax=Amaranthus tricolor TaxID=29722 RepID=UPI002588B72F|nr:peroxidase P7-like [Amaranthus tricolor]
MAFIKHYFLLLVIFSLSLNVYGKLSTNFYSSTCPNVLNIIKEGVDEAIKKETRVGGSILRLHFHDCFVNGCDGSILLDNTSTFQSEKTAAPNNNSARGFEAVDLIKAKVEKACPGIVSCADILAIIARDAVVYYGGPTWKVRLGRRDSLKANRSAANAFLPGPSFDLNNLTTNFANVGLSFRDLIVLSGAHTIGVARCATYRAHIYNDNNIDPAFAKSLQQTCPRNTGNNNTLQPLDYQTNFRFDEKYYQNLIAKKGLLHSDQVLYNGNQRADYDVKKYANDQCKFFKAFAKSMVRMGNIKPLTGTDGEIRLNCRKPN